MKAKDFDAFFRSKYIESLTLPATMKPFRTYGEGQKNDAHWLGKIDIFVKMILNFTPSHI